MHICFIIASPPVARYFRHTSLLGSLQNAILLLCTHAQNRAHHIHYTACTATHPARGPGPPYTSTIPIGPIHWCFWRRLVCYFWTHGYLAMTLYKCDYQLANAAIVSCPPSFTEITFCWASAAMLATFSIAWYACCSSALEKICNKINWRSK